MQEFVVSLSRFHIAEPDTYLVCGYCKGNSLEGSRMRAVWGQEELPLRISVREGLGIRQKYFSRGIGYEDIDREFDLWITLPKEWKRGGALRVWQEQGEKRRCVFKMSAPAMKRQRSMPDGYLETLKSDEKQVAVGGWAVGNGLCQVRVIDSKGQPVESTLTRHYRQDITDQYPELTSSAAYAQMPEEERIRRLSFGFEVKFARPAGSRITLLISCGGRKMTRRVDIRRGAQGLQGSKLSYVQKGYAYLQRNGLARTAVRFREKVSEKLTGREESYMAWRRHVTPSPADLEKQRAYVPGISPRFSIVVPLYRTPEAFLRELAASVRSQTYARWELCLSDGSGEPSPLTALLQELSAKDERILFCTSGESLGISENTNRALSMATGDYIVFADHDDLLTPDALYECVRMLEEHPDADLLYSDEDKVSMNGRTFFEPHFKSDFNIDLLRSMNYFCHLVVVSKKLYEQVGGLDSAYNGAQDYDFVLRCTEKSQKICHIPKVLYHWRSHAASTAEDPRSKMYAFEAGMRAIQAHYDRVGIDAQVVMGEYPGLYRTIYHMPAQPPLISIIIPNKDHVDDLDKCVRTILEKATYPRYEFVIVENNSVEERTFAYYRQMEKEDERFRVVTWEDTFNYSLINNFGVTQAKGEYLLFLNNDTQIIDPDCLQELLGPCLREEVGAVGARLLYEDGTIQHAGVIMGYGGIAGHAFQGMPGNANGYFSRIICQSDLSAVTAACMMVRRSVFEKAGGFDPTLQVAFNDIDFCLRLRSMGLLIVYNPFARLYHYESKSRGMEDTPGKISRFNREADELLRRWGSILRDGDPYYNPNLSLDRVDFALKKM